MKLLQLNMWWGGKLEDNISDFIQRESPDIVCLQEAASTQMADPGLFLTIEKLQEVAGYSYSAFSPFFSINLMHGKLDLGIAILSKLPIKRTEFFYTNLEYNENFDFSKHDYNIRSLLECVIKADGKDLNVLTHHGYHVHAHKNGTPETEAQMQQIAERLQELHGPTILTGDFNLAPTSKSVHIIEKHLTNLSTKYKLTTTRNQLTKKKEVCDYIFVNDDVKVAKFEASDELISDHKALLMEFGL